MLTVTTSNPPDQRLQTADQSRKAVVGRMAQSIVPTLPARSKQDEALQWRLENLPPLGSLNDPRLWRLENLPPLSLSDWADVGRETEPEFGETASYGISGYLTGLRLYTVVFGLSVSYFLILLNSTVVVTAIPRITSDFDSIADIGWYGSAYLLANCSLQPLTGKIYTHHSLKCAFLSFLGVFELGSFICGVSPSSKILIIGRAVAGSGASGIMNGGMTIIAACAPMNKRPSLIGFAISVATIGQITGPLLGGVLTQHATWRWCFFLNLPLGGATALLFFSVRIPEQRKKTKSSWKVTLLQLDLVGFTLFAPAVIMFLLALEWGGHTYEWRSAVIIGLFCGAFGMLCLFLGWEMRKGRDAMIPLFTLGRRAIASSYLTAFFQWGALVETTYFLPLWFQAVKGHSPTMSGVDILPTLASQILFAGVTGLLVSRLGYYLPFVVTGSAMTAVGGGLISTLTPSATVGKWVGYQILTGGGKGLVMQQPLTAVQAVASSDEVAIATSILAFAQYLGGATFVSAANALFNNVLVDSLHKLAPDVDAQAVINAGATAFRRVVLAADLQKVLLAYNRAVTQTFTIAAGAGAIATLTGFGMGWISVEKR